MFCEVAESTLEAGLEVPVLTFELFWQAPTIKPTAKLVTAKVIFEECLFILYVTSHPMSRKPEFNLKEIQLNFELKRTS